MARAGRHPLARLFCLLVAASALGSAGCLVVAAGAAAGGAAAATYAYVRGQMYREYPVPLDEAHAAVRTALNELQLTFASEDKGTKSNQSYVEGRTGDGKVIRINLVTRSHPIPAEGVITRVSVRVGALGDDAVTKRLLDQVSRHLKPMPADAPQPAPAVDPATSARPPETPPPPLAR
jgi:hypothetical protein